MSKPLSRRDALIHLGLGAAGLLWLPRGAAAASETAVRDLSELADLLRETPHDQIFGKVAGAIRAGLDHETLLGAAFVAGVHDIRPRSVGGKLHAVMMVESAYQLAGASSEQEAWLAALWSVNDFKLSQERDRSEGDWVLPPRPEVAFVSAEAARRELVAAMEAWDAERADRALVGLLPHTDLDSLFEILWPYGARCFVDIGHKVIFCAQVERVIRRLGGRFAEPALRSLVNGLLYLDDSISGSEAAVFERSRELASRLPGKWLEGREDPERSLTLLRALRESGDPKAAQELVVSAFADGLGPSTVWDGLRLWASEILHRRNRSALRRHVPVHGVTEVNAFAYAFRTTKEEATRRLLILQAAGWLSLMHRTIVGFYGPMEDVELETLGAAVKADAVRLEEVFEEPSPERARALMDATKGNAAAFLERLRSALYHKAFQSHQYKYVAAIQEESALVHPRWASRILAPSVTYAPTDADPDTEVLRRSLGALRAASVA